MFIANIWMNNIRPRPGVESLFLTGYFYTHANPLGFRKRTLDETMPEASHICTLNNAIDNGSAVACL